MSLVKVQWTESKEFEAVIEVPGFDLKQGEPGDLRDAIGTLAPWELIQAEQDVHIDITGHKIIQEGDKDE